VRRALFAAIVGGGGFLALGLALGACGARSELLELTEADGNVPDVRPDVHDAAPDTAIEADVLPIPDAFPDVPIIDECPDAGDTLVYLIGAKSELYSFYPPTLAFKGIGTIACPSSSTPFSMAVTRVGLAYSVFGDGHLFEVATSNAACKSTPYVPSQDDIQTFGMGYAGNADGGETLYIAGTGGFYSQGLATIDTQSYHLDFIAQFQPLLQRCELSGTGDGRLFGFCVPNFGNGSQVVELDPATAVVLTSHTLVVGSSNDAFAFAFWGGDFWIFTSDGVVFSTVTKYDPQAQTETTVAMAPLEVVGAGVSTCAPQ